jgi:hypothetical protein
MNIFISGFLINVTIAGAKITLNLGNWLAGLLSGEKWILFSLSRDLLTSYKSGKKKAVPKTGTALALFVG